MKGEVEELSMKVMFPLLLFKGQVLILINGWQERAWPGVEVKTRDTACIRITFGAGPGGDRGGEEPCRVAGPRLY